MSRAGVRRASVLDCSRGDTASVRAACRPARRGRPPAPALLRIVRSPGCAGRAARHRDCRIGERMRELVAREGVAKAAEWATE